MCSKSSIRRADRAKDLLGFQTYDEVFAALGKSPGRLISGDWNLVFVPDKFGFVMESSKHPGDSFPCCPIMKCLDYCFGLHFCATHFVDKEQEDALNEEVIRTIVGKLENQYKIPYRGGPDPEHRGYLYEAVQMEPFHDGEYKVTRAKDMFSLKIENISSGKIAYTCASKTECYSVGEHPAFGNYWCDQHRNDAGRIRTSVSSSTGKQKKIHKNEVTRQTMYKGMRRLVKIVNGGEAIASNKISCAASQDNEPISPDLRKCFRQWRTFIRFVRTKPDRMIINVDGVSIAFQFKKGKLNYFSKNKILPICAFPFCGKKTGKSRKEATQFCEKTGHASIGSQELSTYLDK